MLLTVDTDGDIRGERRPGGDGSVRHVTPEYRPVVLLPGEDFQSAHRLPVPATGQAGVALHLRPVRETEPGDLRWRRAASTGAGQTEGLALHSLHAGLGDGGGARGQQNSEADGGRVELHPGPVLLDSTLELAIVSLVVCVRDVEIIATLGWAGLHPAVITVRTKSSERGGNIGQSEQRHANLPALLG